MTPDMSYEEKEMRKWEVWSREMESLRFFHDLDVSNCSNCHKFDSLMSRCMLDENNCHVNKNTICLIH